MINTKIVANVLCAGVATLALVLAVPVPVQAGGRSHRLTNKPKRAKTPHPVLGNPGALVRIVVYGDMQCPYTRILMTRTLPQLLKAYPKKVQVIWRDNPLLFHRGALPAARAGREVFKQLGSKAFFAFQKLVFANLRSIDVTNLVAWAQRVGANSAKVSAVLAGTAHQSWIKKDQQHAKSRGVKGTPSSFVNGQNVRGSASYKKFKTLVDSL
jgi:protein-disulfide isomerase